MFYSVKASVRLKMPKEQSKKGAGIRSNIICSLLTVLPCPDVIDLSGDATIHDKENEAPLLPKLNAAQGVSSYYVDLLLIEEEMKNEGRKKRNQEVKS
jgi:hypothetical protein